MENVDAIILAGGLGTRLRSVVADVPKVLAQVNGRPFLDILLGVLVKRCNLGRVVIAAGYMADRILERYRNCHRFGVEIDVSVEEELLGTGGAIKLALARTNTQDVLVLNGDSFIDVDYAALYRMHRQHNAQLTMVLKYVENSNRYGSVTLDGTRITSFREKDEQPSAGLINAGVYLLNRKLFDQVKSNRVISMENELLPQLIKQEAYGYISEGRFIDIGLPESYARVSECLMEG